MLIDMAKSKYTKEVLEEAASQCVSYLGMVRFLGKKPHGGLATYLKNKCREYGIDCLHFKGQGWSKGKTSPRRKGPVDVLAKHRVKSKEKASVLRRALLAIGREYVCVGCGGGPRWNGKDLVLQVDHIDGDSLNNLPENLRFLCPNCHSQTETFGAKNIKVSS